MPSEGTLIDLPSEGLPMIHYFTILYLFYIRVGGFKDLFSRSPMWEGDYICVLLIFFGDIRIVQEVLQKVLEK